MFLISKIIGHLLDPMLWILFTLLAAWIVRNKKWKKRLYIITVIMFLFFSNSWVINNIWNRYQWQPVELKEGEKYKAGILLGGLAGYDEYKRRGLFNQSSDRFIQAARLYETGRISNVLVTGGNAIFVRESGYNEADFIIRNLIDLHVPSEHILAEKKAKNTIENAALSKQLLDSARIGGPYLLITSAIHMPRAMAVFTKAGLSVKPFPCNYIVTGEGTELSIENFIPSGNAFSNWNTILKEWVGMLQIKLRG